MARNKGTFDAILLAVVDRLISQVGGLDEANCYLSLNPDVLPMPNPGDFVCVVAPTSGMFSDSMFEGGGVEQTTSDSGIIVKIHSPVQLDEVHRDAVFLTDATLGLIAKVRSTLKALSDWSPGSVGSELTRDPLIPSDFAFTRNSRSLGACELTFKLSFDWDLS